MLPLLETFLDLLMWNSFQCRLHISLYVFKLPEIFVPLRQTSQIREIGWVFHFGNRLLGQKLLDTERLVSCSIVTVENPIVGPTFRPFSTHSFTWLLQYFHIISLADTRLSESTKFCIFSTFSSVLWHLGRPYFHLPRSPDPLSTVYASQKTLDVSVASPHKPRRALRKRHLYSLLISHVI